MGLQQGPLPLVKHDRLSEVVASTYYQCKMTFDDFGYLNILCSDSRLAHTYRVFKLASPKQKNTKVNRWLTLAFRVHMC